MFDYDDEKDFFDENDEFIQSKHDAMWNAYI
jgi:hypothetical protein